MPQPRHDSTGVVDVPASVHNRDNGPLNPCRNHLFELLSTVKAEHLHRTAWYIAADAWQAIRANPALRSDWSEQVIHRGDGSTLQRRLLGQPVTLVHTDRRGERALDRVQLVIDLDCKTDR
jgi:hypothetical protein